MGVDLEKLKSELEKSNQYKQLNDEKIIQATRIALMKYILFAEKLKKPITVANASEAILAGGLQAFYSFFVSRFLRHFDIVDDFVKYANFSRCEFFVVLDTEKRAILDFDVFTTVFNEEKSKITDIVLTEFKRVNLDNDADIAKLVKYSIYRAGLIKKALENIKVHLIFVIDVDEYTNKNALKFLFDIAEELDVKLYIYNYKAFRLSAHRIFLAAENNDDNVVFKSFIKTMFDIQSASKFFSLSSVDVV